MEPNLQALALRTLAALDLTSLGEDDDMARIEALCAAARTPHGAPAALCVYPEWVATCRARLQDEGLAAVRVATVVNFPDGGADPARVQRETRRALAAGAHEIDVVLPWRRLQAGDAAAATAVLRACREACGTRARMKVILETGMLHEDALIDAAAGLALDAGADFLKTSTGKVAVNATPAAAQRLLQATQARGGRCGVKVAGGVRTLAQAATYFALADAILGPQWATPQRFRIGASSLLDDILAALDAGSARA
ncbi:deoxyribose-phosphate aldolase [Cognatiluteimonas weifangensis]|uniref:Deoxyribose-phosphate aldolase n=1 Tax=Cognatiluteimonas weifangensis TaxID=2303539 RepID=A0A372DN71_9GAMM|nr:deoxyribose-phosphate aldolase [Luteimonas weifangensis]RFP60877.1 deoxyribose-phosphate aldolase [Luteimonas weifangensis]